MAFEIDDWNINPNQVWYVRLYDSGFFTEIELYNTESDAQRAVDRVANGSAVHGTAEEVTLTNDPTEPDIEFFNNSLTYHMKVSGDPGDPLRITKVNQFTDLDEIASSLFTSAIVIQARAFHEINLGTHTRMERSLELAEHDPDMDEGTVLRLMSDMRGLDNLVEVEELTINISQGDDGETRVTEVLSTIEWLDFRL